MLLRFRVSRSESILELELDSISSMTDSVQMLYLDKACTPDMKLAYDNVITELLSFRSLISIKRSRLRLNY